MAKKTLPLDPADLIETPEDVARFVEAAFEDGTAAEIAHALGAVARSKGMAALAEQTGLSRQALYKTLADDGNPTLDTFLRIIRALGLKLVAAAA
jgi:probable addiction module antidote protein